MSSVRGLAFALACFLALGACDLFTTYDELSAGGTRPVDGGPVSDGGTDGPLVLPDGAPVPAGPAYVIVAGGATTTPDARVWIAPLDASGELGEWTPGPSLPSPLARGVLLVRGQELVLVGGLSDVSSDSFLYTSTISAGKLTSWTSSPVQLPTGRSRHGAFIAQNALHVVGGWSGKSESTTVADSLVSPFGASALGAFTTSTPLPERRHGHVTLTNGTYAWVVTGTDVADASAPVNTANGWVGTVQAGGGLGAWRSLTQLSGGATSSAGGALTSSHVYISGGYSSARYEQVRTAAIAADGSLGPWTSLASLTNGRTLHKMLYTRGRLYVLGGEDTNRVALTSVEIADVNTDGTLSPWRAGRPLPVALITHAAAVYEGD